jgi:hypothetical protein
VFGSRKSKPNENLHLIPREYPNDDWLAGLIGAEAVITAAHNTPTQHH